MVPAAVIAAVTPIRTAIIRRGNVIGRRVGRRIKRRGRIADAGRARRAAEARCDDVAVLALKRHLTPRTAAAGDAHRRAGRNGEDDRVIGARSLPQIDIGIDGGRRRRPRRRTTGLRRGSGRRSGRRSGGRSTRRPRRRRGLVGRSLRRRRRGRLIRWRWWRSRLRRRRLIGRRRRAGLGGRGLCGEDSERCGYANSGSPFRRYHSAVQ